MRLEHLFAFKLTKTRGSTRVSISNVYKVINNKLKKKLICREIINVN